MSVKVWSGPYFRLAFADNQADYAVAQAAISAIGASVSGLIGGATADWLVANASPDTIDPIGRRLWIVIVGSILAAPAWYWAVQPDQSFQVAMTWLAAEYVAAECWFGPTVSTIQSTVGPKIGGTAQGIFTLTAATANFAPTVRSVNGLQVRHDDKHKLPGKKNTHGDFFCVFCWQQHSL